MEYAFWIWLYLSVGKLGWVVYLGVFAYLTFIFALLVSGFESNFGEMTRQDARWSFERELGSPDDLMPSSRLHLRLKKRFGQATAVMVAVALLSSIYPSKEDLMWIIGGAGAMHVAQSEEAQKLPDNVLRAMNSFLEGVAGDPKEEGE